MYTLNEPRTSEEAPARKIENLGPEYLSNRELIQILTPAAADKCKIEDLRTATYSDLKNKVGAAAAAKLTAAAELSRRLSRPRSDQKRFTNPADIYRDIYPFYAGKQTEIFTCAFLDGKNRLIKYEQIATGAESAVTVSPTEIFRRAILLKARFIVLIHNHPSETTAASAQDIHFTDKAVQAGELIGIKIQDHIIFCGETYVSMKKEGLIRETT